MKYLSKVNIIVILIAILVFAFCIVYATQVQNSQNGLILKDYQREKMNLSSFNEEEISTYKSNEDINISGNSQGLLSLFNKNILGEKTIKEIYNKELDRTITRIITENSEIDLDTNGNIIAYKNLDDYSTVDKDKRDYIENQKLPDIEYEFDTKEKLQNIISSIEEESNLIDYDLLDCSNNVKGAWVLTWCKKYENGIINPYDTVNVVIDAKDGSIMLYGRNSMIPNTLEPTITESDAIRYASSISSRYEYTNIRTELTLVRPNFYFEEGGPYEMANFVRLCYNIILDDSVYIYIDAETGEILGGGEFKSVCGRSMFVEDFGCEQEMAMLGYNALNRLGYDQTNYEPVYWKVNQSDMDWILSRTDMYGLYLSCHGNVGYNLVINEISGTTPSGNGEWAIYSNQNLGIWRFVYLDACLTSCTNNFANAFHATYSGECFIGWNVTAYIPMTRYFNRTFFLRLGYMTVHDDVITTLWETRNSGGYTIPPDYIGDTCTICAPGFIGDENYYGWAW